MLLAIKTAFAAALAWLAVQPAGGVADDYPYYAPLGAVVVMSTTVATSVRSATQTLTAMGLGAALSVAVRAAHLPEVAAIAVVIGVGTLLAGWPKLDPQGAYVPVTALFVLIIGGSEPWPYALAYVGFVAVGAAVAMAVNTLWPQVPLTPAKLAQASLRADVARQLEELAEALERPEPLSGPEWESVCRSLAPQRQRVERLVEEALESRRGNWRARRWSDVVEGRHDRARALGRLSAAVDEIATLLAEPHTPLHRADDAAGLLRAETAAALRAVATVLHTVGGDEDEKADPDDILAAELAVDRLRKATLSLPPDSEEHLLAGAGVADALRRATDAWATPT